LSPATDSHGNSATDSIELWIDGDPPQLSIDVDADLAEGPGETLLLHTTSVTGSLETALLVNGVRATSLETDDIAGTDLTAYDTIVVGLDGGDLDSDDMAALRAAVDAGSRVIGFGGIDDTGFVTAVDEHLFEVDAGAASWRSPSAPHLDVVATSHPLARNLPSPHTLSAAEGHDRDPSSAVLRITDPSVTVVARDGDGDPTVVSSDDDALVWVTWTPASPLWRDAADLAVLDQLVGNALELDATVEGPVTVTIDASPGAGSPLALAGYTADGGLTLEEIDVDAFPYEIMFEVPGTVDLVAHVFDRAGNQAVEAVRFHLADQVDPPADPTTLADCQDGGWERFGFANQGLCIRFVNTGEDSRDGPS
jgi:hypothetical protein